MAPIIAFSLPAIYYFVHSSLFIGCLPRGPNRHQGYGTVENVPIRLIGFGNHLTCERALLPHPVAVSNMVVEAIELTDEQIETMNAFMRRHPEVERQTALKFLLGRKFDLERADQCYECYCKTVVEHHLENVTVADVLEELRTQKLYLPGTCDRNGAALLIVNAAKHVPGAFPNESTLKLAFYMGEVATSNPRTQRVGITLISNMYGMEWANFDNVFQRNIINFFQNNIPARVKNIILYRAPWWVTMLVRVVSPFLKEKMRNRIHICGEGELVHFVEASQLPTSLGGTFEYDHEAFIRKEMAKVPSSALLQVTTPLLKEQDGKDDRMSHPPPGTVMLVTDELAEQLKAERQRVLLELDLKIRRCRESLKQHSLPLDITKLIRSRAARMSIDLSALPTLEPNILHLQAGGGTWSSQDQPPSLLLATDKSPIAERPGESYEGGRLEERIAKSIRKDHEVFLRRMQEREEGGGFDGPLREDEATSEASFIPPEDPLEAEVQQIVPSMPRSKVRFATLTTTSPQRAVPSSPSLERSKRPVTIDISRGKGGELGDEEGEEEQFSPTRKVTILEKPKTHDEMMITPPPPARTRRHGGHPEERHSARQHRTAVLLPPMDPEGDSIQLSSTTATEMAS